MDENTHDEELESYRYQQHRFAILVNLARMALVHLNEVQTETLG